MSTTGCPRSDLIRRSSRLLGSTWLLVQVVVLLALAGTAAWLMQRAELREHQRLMASRGRAAAELIAHAAGPRLSLADTPRLLRVLECATRDASIEAAALVDTAGTVVAHTETGRCGLTVPANEFVGPGATPPIGALTALFGPGSAEGNASGPSGATAAGQDASRHVMQPVLARDGRVGWAVVQLPASPPATTAGRLHRYFLPAGLLLLAFAVVSQVGVRRAVRPTTEFLERLARSLDLDQSDVPTGTDDDDRRAREGHDPDGRPAIAMERAAREIEELARSRDELILASNVAEFERKRMETILDSFPDGLVVVGGLEDVLLVNRRALRVLGVGEKQRPRNLSEAPNLKRLVEEADRTGQVQLPVPGRSGEQTILFSRIPLSTAGSQPGETLYTLRDVTAQKASQRTQAEFLSQISHELKAPLNTIVTFVEELAENSDLSTAERREYCNVLSREAGRMSQLIGNLLQLSRIQLGNLSVKMGFVKPGQVIVEQAESMRRHAESHGLELQVNVADNLPAVAGDKDLLGVTITNLVSNAVKYTPTGGRISVTGTEVDGGIAVKVEDSGIGIAEDAREKIFDRFWRADDEQVRAQGGSGLGLSLVKEIVEIHGGEVDVESEPGRGSRFRIWLPAREVGSRPVAVSER